MLLFEKKNHDGWRLVLPGLGMALALAASPSKAAVKTGAEPFVEVERTATVGSPVLTRFRYDAVSVAIPRTEVVKVVLFAIRINAGERLRQISNAGKFKACVELGPCAVDEDGDGTFDRIAKDEYSSSFRLNAPVAYDVQEAINPDASNFRQVVSYMGATGDTLRLSYREFANDMARPAFTEEMTLPLGKSFPQQIAVKDVKLTILGVDGMGLRYRINR